MVGIQATILLAISEYAIVLTLKRRTKLNNDRVIQVQGVNQEKHLLEANKMVEKIDQITWLASALFFIIFNICYWISAIKLT